MGWSGSGAADRLREHVLIDQRVLALWGILREHED